MFHNVTTIINERTILFLHVCEMLSLNSYQIRKHASKVYFHQVKTCAKAVCDFRICFFWSRDHLKLTPNLKVSLLELAAVEGQKMNFKNSESLVLSCIKAKNESAIFPDIACHLLLLPVCTPQGEFSATNDSKTKCRTWGKTILFGLCVINLTSNKIIMIRK